MIELHKKHKNMPKWIKTGSIIEMLEYQGVCYFKKHVDNVQMGGVETFNQATLTPDMLRHFAHELNHLADQIEDNPTQK